jgi:hypothetical protein
MDQEIHGLVAQITNSIESKVFSEQEVSNCRIEINFLRSKCESQAIEIRKLASDRIVEDSSLTVFLDVSDLSSEDL